MSIDLYAVLIGDQSTDAEPPSRVHVHSKVVCRCGRRLALVVGSSCWLVGGRLTRAATADVLLDAALLDFEALAEVLDPDALVVSGFVMAARPSVHGLERLKAVVPPLKLPATWVSLEGVSDIPAHVRTNLNAWCGQCGTLYRLETTLRELELAGRTIIAEDPDPMSRSQGFTWPDAARASRVSLYRHLTAALLG